MNLPNRVTTTALLIVVAASCNSQKTAENPITSMDVETARNLVARDKTVIVLDVRTPEEYAMVHINEAVNINISAEDFSEKVAELDKDKTYVVHCSANVKNGRTAKSLEIMSDLGFQKLVNMEGGIAAWEEKGYPLVRRDQGK